MDEEQNLAGCPVIKRSFLLVVRAGLPGINFVTLKYESSHFGPPPEKEGLFGRCYRGVYDVSQF